MRSPSGEASNVDVLVAALDLPWAAMQNKKGDHLHPFQFLHGRAARSLTRRSLACSDDDCQSSFVLVRALAAIRAAPAAATYSYYRVFSLSFALCFSFTGGPEVIVQSNPKGQQELRLPQKEGLKDGSEMATILTSSAAFFRHSFWGGNPRCALLVWLLFLLLPSVVPLEAVGFD